MSAIVSDWCGGVLIGRRGGRGGAESAGNPSSAIILWDTVGVQRTSRDTAGGTPSANRMYHLPQAECVLLRAIDDRVNPSSL